MYTFDEIIGSEGIIRSMRRYAQTKKPSHAYIISGQAGSGKKLMANTFAKTLQCKNNGPRCSCVSCKTFDSGNHPDIIYVRPDKKKSLGADDIREQVVKLAGIKPYRSDFKIFIIENAGQMTAQAQNALLKTLEEPPPYGVFLLLAENINSFLQTVLSRCVLYKIKPLPTLLVERYVRSKVDGDSNVQFITSYACGSIGTAERLIQSDDFYKLRTHTVDIAGQIDVALKSGRDITKLFSLAERISEFKDDFTPFLNILYMWYRDLAVYIQTGDSSLLLQKDLENDIKKYTSEKKLNAVLNNSEAVWQAGRQLAQNANFRLVVDSLLLKMQ